jgi:hypothetical protein
MQHMNCCQSDSQPDVQRHEPAAVTTVSQTCTDQLTHHPAPDGVRTYGCVSQWTQDPHIHSLSHSPIYTNIHPLTHPATHTHTHTHVHTLPLLPTSRTHHHTCPSTTPGTVLIGGGKDTGKSTLARWLINKLLDAHPEVMLVDLDCGQTEFGPPGIISVTTLRSPVSKSG